MLSSAEFLVLISPSTTPLFFGTNRIWVADITYIAIATGFVYLAAILDAWSCRVTHWSRGERPLLWRWEQPALQL
jgi:transposase InsO family protein